MSGSRFGVVISLSGATIPLMSDKKDRVLQSVPVPDSSEGVFPLLSRRKWLVSALGVCSVGVGALLAPPARAQNVFAPDGGGGDDSFYKTGEGSSAGSSGYPDSSGSGHESPDYADDGGAEGISGGEVEGVPPPVGSSPDPARGSCHGFEDVIGKQLRVVEVGKPVTMDYSEDRLNILVDRHGKIVRVYLG